jgi:hypothetical protein
MSHKCGFTMRVLMKMLQDGGFQSVAAKRRLDAFDLWALATKSSQDETVILDMAKRYLP